MSREGSISKIQAHLDGNASIEEQDDIKVRDRVRQGIGECGIERKHDSTGMSRPSSDESMLICRPRLIIHLRILLDISPILDEWSRIWSKSFSELAMVGRMRGSEANDQNQNA